MDIPHIRPPKGDVHALGNPHYLLDPVNARLRPARSPSGRSGRAAIGGTVPRIRVASRQRWTRAGFSEDSRRTGARSCHHHKDFNYFAARFGLRWWKRSNLPLRRRPRT
jgi:hypothetical protein